MSVHISGSKISAFSAAVLSSIAEEANVSVLYVTSVQRTVEDQARIFFKKHVKENTPANYKNPAVKTMIEAGKKALVDKVPAEKVVDNLAEAIRDAVGGPGSISKHLNDSPFIEIFDIAHYSQSGGKRKNYMTTMQAKAFLKACRARLGGCPISRLGHSAELGLERKDEFVDEKCFHFEIFQPLPAMHLNKTGLITA